MSSTSLERKVFPKLESVYSCGWTRKEKSTYSCGTEGVL